MEESGSDDTSTTARLPGCIGSSPRSVEAADSLFLIIVWDTRQQVYVQNLFRDARVRSLEIELASLQRVPSMKQLWRLVWIACCAAVTSEGQELLPVVIGCKWCSVACIVLRSHGRQYARAVIAEHAAAAVAAAFELAPLHSAPSPPVSEELSSSGASLEDMIILSEGEAPCADEKMRRGPAARREAAARRGAKKKADTSRQSLSLADFDEDRFGGDVELGEHEEREEGEPGETAREAKRDEEIDEMFADLETAVKYLGKVLYTITQPSSSIWSLPLRSCVAALGVLLVLAVCLAVVLPTFFSVLVVRMLKVETSKQQFVHRGLVIAAETAAKHTLRLTRLLLRALPMIIAVVVYPWVLLHAVVPRLRSNRRTGAFVGIAAFVSFVVVLQLQGTVRATLTFRKSAAARERTRHNAAVVIQRWWRWLRGAAGAGAVVAAEGAKAAVDKAPPSVNLPTAPELPGLSLQLALDVPRLGLHFRVPWNPDFVMPSFKLNAPQFGMAFFFPDIPLPALELPFKLPVPPPLPPLHVSLPCSAVLRDVIMVLALLLEAVQLGTLSLRLLPKISWFDYNVLPVIFIRTETPAMVFFWMTIGAVGGVVLLIAARMMYEIRRFEALQRTSGRQDADAFFFHSFVGSLLYGHGQPEHLPGLLCGLVSLVCNTLFFALVDNLCSVMVCFSSSETHIAGTGISCWGVQHRRMVTVALISFGYFVPLSILVAPVLAEANKNSTRVGFVKPYLMCINLSKVVAVMLVMLFSSRELPCMVVSLCLCLFIATLTLAWGAVTSLKQPATLPAVNVIRFLFASGAVLCSLVAFMVFALPEPGALMKYAPIVGILVTFDIALPGLVFVKGVPARLLR